MRIGIVTVWFERGAAYVSRQYCNSLSQKHDVFIYARGGESYATGDPVWDNDRVTWGRPSVIPIHSAIDLKDFKKWLEREKIDIVFFNEQRWWDPVILCNQMGLLTGAYVDYYTEETAPLFNNYDFLICNTKRHHSVFRWHPQCFYIPWGTEPEIFKSRTFDAVSPEMITFFHSAGMNPKRKGTGPVLEAFSEIKDKARLVIHSQKKIREEFPDFKPKIDSMEQSGRLKCYENTVPAPGLYHMGDVYLYPSTLEGIGLTIAEAMACGLPVITSDNPPMNEFVQHGENGRLVKIDSFVSRADGYYWPQCLVNRNDLRFHMEWYVENFYRIPELKRQAREYAEQNLSWTSNSGSLAELFSSVRKRPQTDLTVAARKAMEFEQKRQPEFARLVKPARYLINYLKKLKPKN